jgi:trehalose 6-phosphate phosphatase
MPEPHRTGRAVPAPAVRAALAPLLVRPATSAVLTDFDGTISPIVTNPHEARPVGGAGAVLAALARRFAEVAVVSGRSVAFLAEHLGVDPPTDPAHRVRLVGLYGLEQSWGDGPVTRDPGAEAWQPAVDAAAASLRRDAPSGVLVEPKGLAVTVHWRRAPEAEAWVGDVVAAEVARSGLRAHPGRLSVELRPPLDIDKGSVVRDLAGSCSAACYFGDDLGDLPAFAALAAMRSGAVRTVSVAVLDAESDPAVAEAADVTVTGQGEALDALAWLAGAASDGPAPPD